MDTSRAGRRERRRPGYCTNCYARPASQGKRTCAHCLAYRRSVRAERRAGWQCVICSADTEPCRKHCPACLDAMARREAGRRPEPTRVLRCSLCGGERHNAATCARRAAVTILARILRDDCGEPHDAAVVRADTIYRAHLARLESEAIAARLTGPTPEDRARAAADRRTAELALGTAEVSR